MPHRIRSCSLLLAVLGLVTSCTTTDRTDLRTLSLTHRDSAGITLLLLSESPTEIARGGYATDTLQPDLTLGGADEGFGHLADVAGFGDGSFVVLDRLEKTLLFYSVDGTLEVTFGREGGGPGEYHDPWALTAAGNRIVVWDADPAKTFTVLERTGEVVATAPAPVEGDWAQIAVRGPHLHLEFPYQMSPEDITRRIDGVGQFGFVHQIQPDERRPILEGKPLPAGNPPAYLVEYDFSIRIRDTLSVLSGPRSVLAPQVPGSYPILDQELFAARPVWTTGDGWLATGHGDSASVRVTTFEGKLLAILTWPEERTVITDSDRLQLSRWYFVEHMLKDIPSFADEWKQLSKREREELIRQGAFKDPPFADTAPLITAMYGAGQCLWIAGFSPSDYADGTALTWLAINLRNRSVGGIVRLPHRGSRVREIDGVGLYTSYRDELGIQYLARYPVSQLGCGLTGRTGG